MPRVLRYGVSAVLGLLGGRDVGDSDSARKGEMKWW